MQHAMFVALVALPVIANAQMDPQKATRENEAELDAASPTNAFARDAIKIEAGSDSSEVSIKASTKLDDGRGATRSLSLIAKAPLNKGENMTSLATQHGLAGSTTLALAYTHNSLNGIRTNAGEEALQMCETNNYRLKFQNIKANKDASFECDTGSVKSLLENGDIKLDEYKAFRAKFFEPNAFISSWTVTLSGGYVDSKYFDPITLEGTKKRNSTGGLSVSYSYVPIEAKQLFAATVSLQSEYKDKKASTTCLPTAATGNALLTCATGSIGAPDRKTTQTLELEWRRAVFDRFAFSLQVARDFKEKVTTVQVPMYLIGNDKDGLNGGVNLGWSSEDKKAFIGVFVGKAFSVQP
jgi:hypothetical protein